MADAETATDENLVQIPQVPTHLRGLVGNLPDVDPSFFAKSIWHLADLYGPIFQLDLVSRKVVVISNYELMKEVLDDDKYEKWVSGALLQVRNITKDGLFTAHSDEPNWAKAHRILMPVFGPVAIRKMFNEQLEIASQMILRWDRLGPDHPIICSDDFTRLAFDTIGICAFNYRFNNFYAEKVHPFVTQMAESLLESGKRGNRTKLETGLRYFSQQTYQQNINAMHQLCDEIVEERIRNPQPEIDDLLNTMINVADPVTGEKLSKENIRYQMVTFLIAGHETTSGTLSFLFYHLLHNPETYHKAQKEVDDVLGDTAITLQHLPQLKYVDACIKETLRVRGPIAALSRHAKKPTVLAGKYRLEPEQTIHCNLDGLHHDPAIWGSDADVFKPERMLEFDQYPPGAWRPFGTGVRSCIGRAFAEQEMLINVALILQRFQVEMENPSYNLALKSTMTIKPDGFAIKVKRRPGKGLMVGLERGTGPSSTKAIPGATKGPAVPTQPLTILYGSNAGTCKAYADELAANARTLGFTPVVNTMDSATERLSTESPVVIITPSYEGKPPDNAKKFVSWLEANADNASLFSGVRYAVFGVGNSEWASTFHRIPKLVDSLLGKMGAEMIMPAEFADVKVDPIGPWEGWCEHIWPHLRGDAAGESAPPTKGLQASITRADSVSTLGGAEMSFGIVRENRDLGGGAVGPVKKHMEVELPEGVAYRTGDYIVVLPFNHRDVMRRVLHRFDLHADDMIEIKETNKAFLKTDTKISIYDMLASRVELGTPISQRQLGKLAAVTADPEERKDLEQYQDAEAFLTHFLSNRFSVLDVLEDYQSCRLTFVEFLDLLQPLSPRQYSISSSPLGQHSLGANNACASVTYDVHEAPAFSQQNRIFHGVASSFLNQCSPGTRLRCFVRATNAAFHLPKDSSIPIIMVAAGTGIAPMRGFIEERAAIVAAKGRKLGPALLYFGCRDIDQDYIYRHQLEDWERAGAVSLRPCFSRHGPADGSNPYRYTSDRIWAERDQVADLFARGAKIFVCGSASRLAKSTADVCKKIWLERNSDCSARDAEEWLDRQKEDRYVSDVFG